MQDVKRAGKVRAIGISFKNGRPNDPLYPAGYGSTYISQFMQWGVFDVMQIVYGGLLRQSEVRIGSAAESGIGMIIRGVIRKYFENLGEMAEKAGLDALCESGESRNNFLIRFALSHPGISTLIIGTKSTDHLAENLRAAAKGKLPESVYAEAKRHLDAIGIVAEPA